jgi:dihydropyrimidine dehydrogenase (NAD+) subunit PreA/dihydroorotate dehydrogenase (NAD+) catalytic subunit
MQHREQAAARLATQVGRLSLKNPVICGSGEHVMTESAIDAAIDAGVAAVVAKSAGTSEAARRQLDSAAYAVLGPDWSIVASGEPPAGGSLLNRSGLVDVALDEWARTLARADRRAAARGAYVVGSVLPAVAEDAPAIALAMAGAGVRWIELNLSAPHATEVGDRILRIEEPAAVRDVVASVRAAVDAFLTVKLTSESADVAGLAAAAHAGGADSVCLCGRRMGFLPDPDTGLPVLGTFGAFGGGWELPLTLRWIAKTRARCEPALPILGTGGARCGRDVVRFLLAGACAVQLTTAVYTGGFAVLEQALADIARHLEEHGTSVGELVGAAADAVLTYDEAAQR